jgi:hypothetical protein
VTTFDRDSVDDPDAGFVSDLSNAGAPLLIAFGGIHRGIGIPPFEFFRSAAGVTCNKMFVRDLHQAWYHRGVPGLGEDIDSNAAALAILIDSHEPRRVVMTGNSAGGYASLLFATLVPRVDTVLAFAPQTFIDTRNRVVHGDPRWHSQITKIHARSSKRYFDLQPVISEEGARSTGRHIFVGIDSRLDRVHARRLSRLPGIQVHEFDAGGHRLIRSIRDSGLLTQLLEAALRAEPLPDLA